MKCSHQALDKVTKHTTESNIYLRHVYEHVASNHQGIVGQKQLILRVRPHTTSKSLRYIIHLWLNLTSSAKVFDKCITHLSLEFVPTRKL